MSERQGPLKAGQLALALDRKSKMPQGFVVTKATLTGTVERLWSLKPLSSKKWRLSLWHKHDDKPPVPIECAEFDAETKQEAEAKARAYKAHCEKIWNPQEETAFTNVPSGQQERWIDAWIQAHKSEWPNLFSLVKGEDRQDVIKKALAADLIAHGFNANAVTTITPEICDVVTKTKITASDKLNLWLVANWFHGEKLFEMRKKARGESAKRNGFPAANGDSVGMKITRLGLTARSGCQ